MVKGRREGTCEDCEERHGKEKIRLLVNYRTKSKKLKR